MALSTKQKKLITANIMAILDLVSMPDPEDTESDGSVDEDEDENEDERAPTLNAVRKAMRDFAKTNGKDEAKAMLEPYDVKSLSALEESDYAALLDDIENY